ncbi:hypothetical protein [uncultured Mucilaginibacter sp.]|uniref:hypothetical protein n=1 Tax=uncultured Mucilaginibacter sp. TaxID=797541 RepID=UPI0025FC53FB|nr:hypothetical protein [uncultured Mucilaginibacter sp.]
MRPLFVILLVLTACSGNAGKTADNDSAITKQTRNSALSATDTTYMPTGFYFLADSSTGVKMRMRGSGDVFVIARNAFASVKNIVKATLKKTSTKKGVYTELCMTFDSKGTHDLKEGTGNFLLQPKIAMVVANQLLYVVDNNAKITTGVVFVALLGYSDTEMRALQDQVEHKK